MSAAQFLPFAVLALPAGVWADRLDRKKILITSDAVRFACQLTAATLLLTDHATVTHLVVLAAVYGARGRVLRARRSPACCPAPSHRSTCSRRTR